MKKHTHEQGFSAVEALIIVVVVGILGFAGWFVLHAQKAAQKSNVVSSTTTSTSTKAKEPATATGFTNGPGADWQTYTNGSLGFSVAVPKKVLSPYGAPCTQRSYVYDNYGNKVPSQTSYQPTSGITPATVTQLDNDFYITPALTYQPSGETDDADGHAFYGSCPKVEVTSDVVQSVARHDGTYSLPYLRLTVADAKDQGTALNVAKKVFNDDAIVVKSTTEDAGGGWQNMTFDCAGSGPCTDFNFRFTFRYYPAQHKVVYFAYGQAAQLQTPDGSGFYDQQIGDSVKLL